MAHSVATHLMFTGDACAALELYASAFSRFRVERVERYGPGEPGPEGTVKRADATLYGHALVVIDSPVKHAFTFTPARSLFIDCETPEVLDAAFAALSANGQMHMPIDNYGSAGASVGAATASGSPRSSTSSEAPSRPARTP